jgi:hypothetical protein
MSVFYTYLYHTNKLVFLAVFLLRFLSCQQTSTCGSVLTHIYALQHISTCGCVLTHIYVMLNKLVYVAVFYSYLCIYIYVCVLAN